MTCGWPLVDSLCINQRWLDLFQLPNGLVEISQRGGAPPEAQFGWLCKFNHLWAKNFGNQNASVGIVMLRTNSLRITIASVACAAGLMAQDFPQPAIRVLAGCNNAGRRR